MTISEGKRKIPNPRDRLKRFDSSETGFKSLVLHWMVKYQNGGRCASLDTPTDIFFALQEKVYSVCNAESDTTQLRQHEKRGSGRWD